MLLLQLKPSVTDASQILQASTVEKGPVQSDMLLAVCCANLADLLAVLAVVLLFPKQSKLCALLN
jgi:hypothetical protein